MKPNLQGNVNRTRTPRVNKNVTGAVYLGTHRNENVNKKDNKAPGKCVAQAETCTKSVTYHSCTSTL